jgi:hypothetical protein
VFAIMLVTINTMMMAARERTTEIAILNPGLHRHARAVPGAGRRFSSRSRAASSAAA